MSLRPRSLPKVRDRLRALLTEPDSPLREATPELAADHERVARLLGASDLWWATADMAALAIAAAADLPEVRWATADRPSACGLLVWDGGIGEIPYQGVNLPVDAVSWGPHPDGFGCTLWVRLSRIEEAVVSTGRTLVSHGLPPLAPMVEFVAPVTADPYPAEEIDNDSRTVLTTLATTWLLMQQPKMVDRSRVEVDRSTRSGYGRAGRPQPEVTLVDLRRLYVPNVAEQSAPAGRIYSRRWVVRGHWRNQAHGPDRALRRQTWVPNYIKGPDGAPLIVTDHVNVWRR
ncbi:hypothetical protein [Streptosporangium roseum]|uniref:hypothetical protein n=1 Tax=Streptosporangium roseum TaxID=2001 RepID=UPI0004CCD2F5|nr:hypothetical protein [Streptosporangium roseum]